MLPVKHGECVPSSFDTDSSRDKWVEQPVFKARRLRGAKRKRVKGKQEFTKPSWNKFARTHSKSILARKPLNISHRVQREIYHKGRNTADTSAKSTFRTRSISRSATVSVLSSEAKTQRRKKQTQIRSMDPRLLKQSYSTSILLNQTSTLNYGAPRKSFTINREPAKSQLIHILREIPLLQFELLLMDDENGDDENGQRSVEKKGKVMSVGMYDIRLLSKRTNITRIHHQYFNNQRYYHHKRTMQKSTKKRHLVKISSENRVDCIDQNNENGNTIMIHKMNNEEGNWQTYYSYRLPEWLTQRQDFQNVQIKREYRKWEKVRRMIFKGTAILNQINDEHNSSKLLLNHEFNNNEIELIPKSSAFLRVKWVLKSHLTMFSGDIINQLFSQSCFLHRMDKGEEYVINEDEIIGMVNGNCLMIKKKTHEINNHKDEIIDYQIMMQGSIVNYYECINANNTSNDVSGMSWENINHNAINNTNNRMTMVIKSMMENCCFIRISKKQLSIIIGMVKQEKNEYCNVMFDSHHHLRDNDLLTYPIKQQIMRKSELIRIPPGRKIYYQTDPSHKLYYVINGEITLKREIFLLKTECINYHKSNQWLYNVEMSTHHIDCDIIRKGQFFGFELLMDYYMRVNMNDNDNHHRHSISNSANSRGSNMRNDNYQRCMSQPPRLTSAIGSSDNILLLALDVSDVKKYLPKQFHSHCFRSIHILKTLVRNIQEQYRLDFIQKITQKHFDNQHCSNGKDHGIQKDPQKNRKQYLERVFNHCPYQSTENIQIFSVNDLWDHHSSQVIHTDKQTISSDQELSGLHVFFDEQIRSIIKDHFTNENKNKKEQSSEFAKHRSQNKVLLQTQFTIERCDQFTHKYTPFNNYSS